MTSHQPMLCMEILPWHRGIAVLNLPLQSNFRFELQFELNWSPTHTCVQNVSKQIMRKENHQKIYHFISSTQSVLPIENIILFPIGNLGYQLKSQVAHANF